MKPFFLLQLIRACFLMEGDVSMQAVIWPILLLFVNYLTYWQQYCSFVFCVCWLLHFVLLTANFRRRFSQILSPYKQEQRLSCFLSSWNSRFVINWWSFLMACLCNYLLCIKLWITFDCLNIFCSSGILEYTWLVLSYEKTFHCWTSCNADFASIFDWKLGFYITW